MENDDVWLIVTLPTWVLDMHVDRERYTRVVRKELNIYAKLLVNFIITCNAALLFQLSF